MIISKKKYHEDIQKAVEKAVNNVYDMQDQRERNDHVNRRLDILSERIAFLENNIHHHAFKRKIKKSRTLTPMNGTCSRY